MIIEKMKEIQALMANDEDAAEKLTNSKSREETVKVLSEYNIKLDDNDINELKQMLSSDEIPDELLELVAGGGFRDWFWGFCDGLVEGWEKTKEFFTKGLDSLKS